MAAYVRVQNRIVRSATMPRKANEIVVEWLESKDAGKRHGVNVKHIIGKLADVAVGGEIVIKLNLRCYHAKIVDLLDWTPHEKKRPAEMKKTKQQELKQVCCLPSYYYIIVAIIYSVSHTCQSAQMRTLLTW